MTRSRLVGFAGFCLFLLFNFLHAAAQGQIAIDENKIRLAIADTAKLKLPITNNNRPVSTSLHLEFLDSDNRITYELSRPIVIAVGASLVEVDVSGFLELRESRQVNYDWLRLRYSVVGQTTGIVSLSKIAPEPFAMTIVAPPTAFSSSRFRMQVLTLDPAVGKPVSEVEVTAKLTSGESPAYSSTRSARSNASGFADLDFELPELSSDEDLRIEVTGKLRAFVRRITDEVRVSNTLSIETNTDKPLYQPGQTLRVRALVFDETREASDGSTLRISISDPEDNKVFETSVITSEFGEAHTQWMIPDNARTGNYQIRIEPESGYGTRDFVWIGRYDLPNFSIDVRSDRPYYTPDTHAAISVHAEFLFGKPVPLAPVKISRELERSWNFRELKWEVSEGETVDGVTDGEGRFLAHLKLDKEFDQLHHRRRFEDISYVAYVTDPATGRTEQRRFRIRITMEPIHIYVREPFRSVRLPLELYITASYADGTPAVCDIQILEVGENDSRVTLRTVTTNKYGVAKVTGLLPSAEFEQDGLPELEFRAADANGKVGRRTEYLYTDEDSLRVYTNKSLYRASEPVDVHIESSHSTGQIVLNASSDGRILHSQAIQMADGKADVVIPGLKSFVGRVLISAYQLNGTEEPLFEGRQVFYPPAKRLEIEATLAKKVYAPGEEAALQLRLRNWDGKAQRGLFGISIFDKAVEERARTDAGSGGRYSTCGYCEWLPGSDSRLGDFTLSALDQTDFSRPIPPDLDLAAEVILLDWSWYSSIPETLGDWTSASSAFGSSVLQKRFDALKAKAAYPSGFHLPSEDAALRKMVVAFDPEFNDARDPWGNPYRLASSVLYNMNRIEVLSIGADELGKTADDFRVAVIQWPFFTEYGRALRQAMEDYHQRTGGYIRDIEGLKRELQRIGHDFDAWRDPTGRRFTAEFGIENTRFSVLVKLESWIIWTERMDYTAELQPRVDAALSSELQRRNALPQSDAELRRLLRDASIPDSDLQDPWGRPYYSLFKEEAGYFDSVTLLNEGEKARILPVTRQLQVIRLRSTGPDGIEGTPDDFTALTFLRPFKEMSTEDADARFVDGILLDPAHGAIQGTVIDSTGALIPGAKIQVLAPATEELEFFTGPEGVFIVRRLDPGVYTVRVSLPGFMTKTVNNVIVRAGVVTRIISTLQIASVQTLVEVSSGASELMTESSASVGEVLQTRGSPLDRQISTPRLRDYFPETLFWNPALVTGRDGRAEIRFKLADSMTTWKLLAIASTQDGRISVVEREIVAFQPFFLEHDPPKVLTQGDRIHLPVVARSYLDKDQSVELSMAKEAWFAPLDNPSRRINIKAGESTREVFSFQAETPITNGRQRVYAQGNKASDAIEKLSTVHPHGREMIQTSGRILRDTSSHVVTIPQNVLQGSVRAELKIYPNLMAHVVDSIEGIMRRPYGCAEQVISSAYPSLLYLDYAKQAKLKDDPTSRKATRYLQIALGLLRTYQADNGGFSYWSRGEVNAAVTAYAFQFLTRASDHVSIQGFEISEVRDWLIKNQTAEGSWQGSQGLTAYIATALSAPDMDPISRNAVERSLAYLQRQAVEPADPYTTASIALAASRIGSTSTMDAALSALRRSVHFEQDGAFWDLQTNTPFYSWGKPGRLEATAVVVRALATTGRDEELVEKGLLFLLRNKDQFGVWFSTQATVRVLDVLVRLVGTHEDVPGSATLIVNNVSVASVLYGTRQQPNTPVVVDISKYLKVGSNSVVVRAKEKSSIASVQVVSTYYVPWDEGASDLKAGPLRFSVKFDKHDSQVGDPITVQVEAERIGFRGYGMMLAEIGLPPGAEVDRESLEKAVAEAGWDLSRYDVLPDRVIAYIWPRAGGTKFEFKFRPRYGLEARSPASKLYDYYNPDAYFIQLPEFFSVR